MTKLPPEEGRKSRGISRENWCEYSVNGRNFEEEATSKLPATFFRLSLYFILNQP
jgi:hypothetical protein